MPISSISLANTFGQWIIVTNSLVNQLNTIESGNYNKANGSLIISSSGVGLQVSSNSAFQAFSRFYENIQVDKLLTTLNLYVSGQSTLSDTSLSNTKIIFRTYSAPSNYSLIVNRGESANVANANAEIKWNETNKYWELRDVNNPTNYFKIITKSDYATTSANGIVTLNDNILSNSSVLAATANTVKISYDISNLAYNQANTANGNAINAFNQANTALSTGQAAFTQANTGTTTATLAFTQANTALTTGQAAFTQANVAIPAYVQANTAFDLANNAGFFTTTTSTSKTLIKREKCHVTANNLVLNLPSSPNDSTRTDDWIVLVTVDNFTNTTIARNGSKIESITDNLKIDIANTSVGFSYINSTIGWKLC